MSDATELARAEADRVEAEEDEANATAEIEADAEIEATPADEPVLDEAAARKAEKIIESKRDALAKVIGAENVAHECVCCAGLGYGPIAFPVGATFEVVEDEAGLSIAPFGPQDFAGLPQAPDKGPCDECAATGEVRTGSKNPHAMVGPCSKCSGNGWVTIARENPTTVYVPPPVSGGHPQASANGTELAADAWGRPAGHPHWGVPPASIGG